MSDASKPPSDVDPRQQWFDHYVQQLTASSVVLPPQPGVRHRCPCCRFLTLDERGGYEICPVCFWEDDGQDDQDAARVRGGPNGSLSLAQARVNFATFHACDEKSKQHVRSPTPDEIDDAPRPLDALLELEPYGRAFATRLKEIDPSLPAGIGRLHELQETVGVATLCCLLAFACQTQNVANIELGRAALLAAPRAWVVGHLVRAAKSTVDLDDPWEVRRLLEISTKLDTALAQAFGADLRLHANDEVREAAADLVPKTE